MRLKFKIILSLLVICGSTSIALSQAAKLVQPCSASSLEHEPTLDSVFNPRLNETEVRLFLPRSACDDYDMWVSSRHPGRGLKTPKELVLGFSGVHCPPNEEVSSCYNLKVVLDEKVSLPLGELWGDGDACHI
jgi:hypothetical protein